MGQDCSFFPQISSAFVTQPIGNTIAERTRASGGRSTTLPGAAPFWHEPRWAAAAQIRGRAWLRPGLPTCGSGLCSSVAENFPKLCCGHPPQPLFLPLRGPGLLTSIHKTPLLLSSPAEMPPPPVKPSLSLPQGLACPPGHCISLVLLTAWIGPPRLTPSL